MATRPLFFRDRRMVVKIGRSLNVWTQVRLPAWGLWAI